MGQGTISVTFLDFENYFNTISLPALFLLKLGINENDVQALGSYYEHSHMRVIHADGEKPAKIPLHRGVRQGCPLSPILGGVVVNAMLRWLDFKGGGLSQGDVVTITLCFADNSTLMTINVHDMKVLLACVKSYCQWAGVKINIVKTELTGYDYKRQYPLDLNNLQLGNGKPEIVMPWDPVKYLGFRHTITGDLAFERYYVRNKSLDTIKQLTKHMYHPQQMYWEVQVAIIPNFRYSAAIANWDSKDIDKLENLWMRAFRKAWTVNASLPDVTFWVGPEQGGLETSKARAIITSETISLMNQCLCLDDELRQVTIQDMSQAIAHLGCSTIAEAQAELQWNGEAWQQQASLCHRFFEHVHPEVCK